MPINRDYLADPYFSNPKIKAPRTVTAIVHVPAPSPPVGALAVYRPATPVLYSRPVTPPRFLAPSSPRLISGASNIAAGSFKAAGTSLGLRTVGRIGLRAIPWVGLAFTALDLALLACAAGYLPGQICPRPDNPAPGGLPPSFNGGQCDAILYTIRGVATGGSFGNTLFNFAASVYGAITGIRIIYVSQTIIRIEATCRGGISGGLQPQGTKALVLQWGDAADSPPPSFTITSVTRDDGKADNCGDLPTASALRELPEIYQNIRNHQTFITKNIYILNLRSPSPLPKREPIIINSPSPLPAIYVSSLDAGRANNFVDPDVNLDYIFAANPTRNYSNNPGNLLSPLVSPFPIPVDPNPVVVAQEVPQSTGSLNNLPQIPPPLPPSLPPNATEADQYIFRQNKEIVDKLYRLNGEVLEIQSVLEKQTRVLENLQNLLDIDVQGSQIIKRCDDLEVVYSYKSKLLPAINTQLNHVKLIEQTIIDEVCEVEASATVASPDWWAVRLGGDIPQLALIFRVITTRTYHKLVVPHPVNVAPLVLPPIPDYKKGNWMGEIICRDNSKFICNCRTKGEATRLLTIASSLIDPVFLGDPPRFYYAERKGVAVSDGDMRATSAQYFPEGQQQTKPLWRVTFTKDGQ